MREKRRGERVGSWAAREVDERGGCIAEVVVVSGEI